MPKFFNSIRSNITICVIAAMFLSGCEVGSQTKGKTPFRAPAGAHSGVSSGNVTGEVGTSVNVTVTLKDKNGFGIRNVIPTVTALNSLGLATGITSGGCSITDTKGNSVCSIRSSVKGLYTVKVLTPLQITGGTIDFFQLPRSLTFSVQPASTAFSLTTLLVPQVTVKDAAGIAMPSAGTVTLTLTTPGLASLGGTRSVAVSALGIATFTNLTIDIAGSYTLTATLVDPTSGTITATSTSISLVAGAATKLAFTVNPTSSVATGEVFGAQPVVIQTDASGNAVTTDNSCVVNLSLAGGAEVGDTLLGSTLSKTMTGGVADFTGQNLRVNRIGTTAAPITTYQLRATPTGTCATIAGNGPFLSELFTVTLAGLPSQMVLIQAPSTAALNETWLSQPIVGILDVNGSPVTSDNTTRVIMTNTTAASGTLVGSTSVAAVGGIVTYSGLKILGASAALAKTYTYNFEGINPGLTISPDITTSQLITSNGLTPAGVEFRVQPQNVAVDERMSPIEVRVIDANGFFCFNDNSSTITLAYDTSIIAASGTMERDGLTQGVAPGITAAVDVVNGIATIAGISFTNSGAKILRATHVATGTTVLSDTVAISDHSNTADHISFRAVEGGTQPADSAATASGEPWTTQPVVTVNDAFGNVMTNDNTTIITLDCLSPASCIGDLLGTTSVRVTNGKATFFDLRLGAATTGIILKAEASPALPITTPAQSSPAFNED